MHEKHVRDVIAEVFRRGGMIRSVRKAEAVVAWPRIAGPELARFSEARALRSGVLFVDVPDSETAMHLALQRSRFLEAYEHRFGRPVVRDIRFSAGRPAREPERATPHETTEPDADELADLARRISELDLPDALVASAMRAGRAMLTHRQRARAAGWTPCPYCGALSPDRGPCDACRRHRDDPGVRAAARTLTVDPEATLTILSDEERVVASALAVEALDRRLAELLPQVLATPDLKPQLERAALHRIALAEGRPVETVSDADVALLDPRLARVLGRWAQDDDSRRTP